MTTGDITKVRWGVWRVRCSVTVENNYLWLRLRLRGFLDRDLYNLGIRPPKTGPDTTDRKARQKPLMHASQIWRMEPLRADNPAAGYDRPRDVRSRYSDDGSSEGTRPARELPCAPGVRLCHQEASQNKCRGEPKETPHGTIPLIASAAYSRTDQGAIAEALGRSRCVAQAARNESARVRPRLPRSSPIGHEACAYT
jgi:hypothetical protein